MALIGQGALILALLLAVYAAAGGLFAGLGRDRRFLTSARNALWAIFALVVCRPDGLPLCLYLEVSPRLVGPS